MIRTFIQVTSLLVTLESAVFLARGGLALRPATIADLATTRYGYSGSLIESFSAQRSDTFVGVVLLLVGFVLQSANLLWPMRWDDFAVHRGAAIYAFVLAVVIGFGAYHASNEIAAYTAAQAKKAWDAQHAAPAESEAPPTKN
jgi:hypothetical protein